MLRLHARIDEIPAAAWDALHVPAAGPDAASPFLRHAFLDGLEATGCLRPDWGWVPRHASLWDGDTLVAAAPAYLKGNSHGEFVFDHAWAAAHARYGLPYYPKWLVGVPYSPVTGPRVLARDDDARRALVAAMAAQAEADGLSSLHLNFLPAAEAAAVDAAGGRWLARHDVQYHWRADPAWGSLEDMLAAMWPKKRKNIRQERERVAREGWRFRVVHGDEAGEAELAAMHRFYLSTFLDKGNHPALSLDFLRHLARAMPRALVLVLGERAGRIAAGALCLRGGDTLYGRYWGCDEDSPGLHFEACYYQGIAYCLREGLARFEPGAQGEHKIARGFLPVLTHSRHRVFAPGFDDALARWCDEERRDTLRYRDAVAAHSPFRPAGEAAGAGGEGAG